MDFFILYSHLSIGLDRTVCPETRRYEDLGTDLLWIISVDYLYQLLTDDSAITSQHSLLV